MNIGILTNYHLDQVGGAEEALDRLAKHWQRTGHAVVMFSSPGKQTGRRRPWDCTYPHVKIPRPFSTRFGLSRYLRYLVREHDQRPMDVLLTMDTYWAGHVARLFHAKRNVPYVVCSQGGDVMHGSRFLRRPVCKERMGLAIRDADAVVCISRYVGDMLHALATPRGLVRTIHNGWPEEWSSDAPGAKLPAPVVSGQYLFSMGRAVELKGFQTVIDALARLRPQYPDLGLVIAADGPYLPTLWDQASRLGLAPRKELPASPTAGGVYLPGFVHGETKRSLAHRATLGVLPSIRQEPQSLALLELLCGGVPVLASHVGGNPDMVKPGVNGDLYTAADAGELASKIELLLSRPQDLARLAAGATPSVEEFRWDRIAEEYLELFREVVACAKRSRAA